jgi:pimeloyl-ACP methyl ester carboxylesterase
MNSVVCLNGNAPVQDTFAPLATHLHGEVALVLKDREAYSRAPGESLTLADEVAGVWRTAEEKELSSFHLLGYSAGGVVALAFTAAYPERVKTLALIEPPWMGNETASADATALAFHPGSRAHRSAAFSTHGTIPAGYYAARRISGTAPAWSHPHRGKYAGGAGNDAVAGDSCGDTEERASAHLHGSGVRRSGNPQPSGIPGDGRSVGLTFSSRQS